MYEDYQNEAPPSPEPQQSQGLYDGATATNHSTGERLVYRISAGGRGRWVAMTPGSANAQDREALQGDQSRLSTLRRLAPLASEFSRINGAEPTGSFWQGDTGRGILGNAPFVRPEALQNLDRMRGIEAEAVRANIQPGTSGTANSVYEQQVLREMFPNREAVGPANTDRTISLLAERDVQTRRVQEMEQWLTQNPDLGMFASHWAQIEPSVREAALTQHRRARGIGGPMVRPQQQRDMSPRKAAAAVRVNTPAEAQRLQPGTRYTTPDGRTFTR